MLTYKANFWNKAFLAELQDDFIVNYAIILPHHSPLPLALCRPVTDTGAAGGLDKSAGDGDAG